MRALVIVFILLLGLFQYNLWFGKGGGVEIFRLKKSVLNQEKKNEELLARNRRLAERVRALKRGRGDQDIIEELARERLGMIKEGEVYYQFVD